MDAADDGGAVVGELRQLALLHQEVVDPGRQHPLDEGHDPCPADLQQHEGAHRVAELIGVQGRVRDLEGCGPLVSVRPGGVSGDLAVGHHGLGGDAVEPGVSLGDPLLPVLPGELGVSEPAAPGVQPNVHVFGEPFDEAEALGQRGAALEPDGKALVVERS